MALQGTIDTFDLTEVIRMLAVGEKTGRLGLSGDRGSGSIWFADGQMVASETDSTPLAPDHAAVLFQLLRFSEGSFVFDQGAEAADAGSPLDAEPILDEALRRISEWSEIESVVPSLEHRVGLATELSRSDVVIDQTRWRALAVIGGGTTVGAVGRELELDELDVSRTVKGLVELTLVEISAPGESDGAIDPVVDEPVEDLSVDPVDADVGAPDPVEALDIDSIDLALAADDASDDEDDRMSSDSGGFDSDWMDAPAAEVDGGARDQLDALASGFGLTDDPYVAAEPAVEVPAADQPLEFGDPEPLAGAVETGAGSFPIEEAEAAGEARTPLFAHDAGAEVAADPHVPAPGEAAEVARQLANLSPEAARAVAAAARATTVEEREAALALVAEDGDEPLDPDLLRSFLSSVRQ